MDWRDGFGSNCEDDSIFQKSARLIVDLIAAGVIAADGPTSLSTDWFVVASIAWHPMDLRDCRWTGEMVLVVTVKMTASFKNLQG